MILDAAERREANDINLPSRRVRTATTGFALLGAPGLGKSLTVEMALEAFPKVLKPDLPYTVTQVPWLKIECPAVGGRKQFCIAFFKALGDRVGERYDQLFGRERQGGDEMVLQVQQLCQVHALGVLVVDEIQHLLQSKEGTKPLMNFLVTLVNTIGVPVILVGTMGATAVVEEDFREARRAAGLGQPTWLRLRKNEEWDDLLAALWEFQWTSHHTPLDAEISAALYDESQGIIDVLVKLFMLCQFRAILQGETRATPELLTPALVASVAKDDFRVIRPMIEALRDGREDILARYPDLKEFHHHFDAVTSRDARMTMEELRRRREVVRLNEVEQEASPDDPLNPFRAFLKGQGMADDLAEATIDEAVRRVPSKDPWALMSAVREVVEGRLPSKSSKPRRVRGPTQSNAGSPAAAATFDDDDLRGVAEKAKARGASVHDGFVEAGTSKTVAEVMAA